MRILRTDMPELELKPFRLLTSRRSTMIPPAMSITLMAVATRPRKIEGPAVEIIVIGPVLSSQMVQQILRLGDWVRGRHGAVRGASGSIGPSWPCTCVMHLEDLEPEMLQRLEPILATDFSSLHLFAFDKRHAILIESVLN